MSYAELEYSLQEKQKLVLKLRKHVQQLDQQHDLQITTIKAKVNDILRVVHLELKKAKRDYLELDLKHSEVTQLLSMLIPETYQRQSMTR